MVEVKNTREGFFSSLFYVINNCHIAERTNDDIRICNFSKCYVDPGMTVPTSFHQYYEDIINDRNLKHDVDFSHFLNIERFAWQGTTTIVLFIKNYEERRYFSFLIKKYLKIKSHIQEKINKHLENFKGKKVLGVHIRQTDHHIHGNLISPLYYVHLIKEMLNNYDMLYVMTDNKEDLELMKSNFKDNLYYLEDVTRSEKRSSMAVHNDPNYKNRYKLGEDILIETMLLSNCDTAIMTNSNIMNFVMAYNPNIKYNILDLGLKNI
jgi:hypothetical protein